MATTIDLSRKTGLVTLGTHTFRVTDKSVEDMGPSENPYWRLICEVISKGEDQGKEVMHSISLGHKSRFVMDEFLDGVDAPRSGKGDLGQFIGKTFRASVGQDTYNGKLKSVLTNIMPVAPGQPSFDDLPSEIAVEDAALPADVVEDAEEESPKPRRGFR